MSRMSNLDLELRAAGIDPEGVDLEDERYAEIARRDWEREMYARCDKEDRDALNPK